jgi:hypothetical protein
MSDELSRPGAGTAVETKCSSTVEPRPVAVTLGRQWVAAGRARFAIARSARIALRPDRIGDHRQEATDRRLPGSDFLAPADPARDTVTVFPLRKSGTVACRSTAGPRPVAIVDQGTDGRARGAGPGSPAFSPSGSFQARVVGSPESPAFCQYVCQPRSMASRSATVFGRPGISALCSATSSASTCAVRTGAASETRTLTPAMTSMDRSVVKVIERGMVRSASVSTGRLRVEVGRIASASRLEILAASRPASLFSDRTSGQTLPAIRRKGGSSAREPALGIGASWRR